MPVSTTLPPGTEVDVGGIVARVWADGYEKGNDSLGGGPWRKILYQVDWDASDGFMDKLLGISTSTTPGGSVTPMSPHKYPGNTNLVCQSVSAELVGPMKPDATKLVSGTFAKIAATYGVPRFGGFDDHSNNFQGSPVSPYSRDTCRGFRQDYPVSPGVGFQDISHPTELGVAFPTGNPFTAIHVPHIEYIRTRFAVPYLFLDILSNLSGSVNNAPFFNRAIGTIKFDHWDTDTEVNTDGSLMQQYALNFTWRPYDWNAHLREDKLQWDICADFTGNYEYPYKDLTPLLVS